MTRSRAAIALTAIAVVAACNAGTDSAGNARETQAAAELPSSPPPKVDIDYEILGNPVVGQPVAINLLVSSSELRSPLILSYRVNDATALTFPQAQANRVELPPSAATNGGGVQQVTVVPHREGRLYLNISAETETQSGSALKSIAIPILVDAAPDAGGPAADNEAGDMGADEDSAQN